jgi:hypothetical protein
MTGSEGPADGCVNRLFLAGPKLLEGTADHVPDRVALDLIRQALSGIRIIGGQVDGNHVPAGVVLFYADTAHSALLHQTR